jgi:hypothetical protein
MFLLLIVLLASCRRNAQAPATVHESEEMLGQYLFGPLSLQIPPSMSPTEIFLKFICA